MTAEEKGASAGDGDDWNLDDWVAYKKRKAHAFVDRGYSVEWSPDMDAWMGVYLPERHERRRPEVRADVKFYAEPSGYGIDNGRIAKLSIVTSRTDLIAQAMGRPFESIRVLYNYDRGLDVDRLATDREAQRLYRAVLDELN